MKPRLLLVLCNVCISISLAAQAVPKYPFKMGPLKAGDVLRITLSKPPNPKTGARIDLAVSETIHDDGTLRTPLLGNIPAAGQTLSEFLKTLEGRYAEYFMKSAEAEAFAEAFTNNTPARVDVQSIRDKSNKPPKTSLDESIKRIGK